MKNLTVLFVGGSWDSEEGMSSRYMSTISEFLVKKITGHVDVYNGGNIERLKDIVKDCANYDVIFWFPNIPPDLKSVIKNPKLHNRDCVLINYRRNDNDKLSFDNLISIALSSRADLSCEVYKDSDGCYNMRVFDNCGVVISGFTTNIGKSMTDLVSRIYNLQSVQYSRLFKVEEDHAVIHDQLLQIRDAYQDFNEVLSKKVDNPHIKRSLAEIAIKGVASDGSPSNDIVYVNASHVKLEAIENLEEQIFVTTRLVSHKINYYGTQGLSPCFNCSTYCRLLNQLPNIDYLIYSPLYVEDAPFTEKILPLGCLQSVKEIMRFVDVESKEFALNLLGRGSIIFLSDISKLDSYHDKMKVRKLPELITPEYDQIVNDDGVNSFINTLKGAPLEQDDLLEIRFDDGSVSTYKILVKYYKDEQDRVHKSAQIRMTIKGIQTEVPIIGLYARRV